MPTENNETQPAETIMRVTRKSAEGLEDLLKLIKAPLGYHFLTPRTGVPKEDDVIRDRIRGSAKYYGVHLATRSVWVDGVPYLRFFKIE